MEEKEQNLTVKYSSCWPKVSGQELILQADR